MSIFYGSLWRKSNLASIHNFYFSVSKWLPPSLSCSELKVLITTPIKRFKRKKALTTVKKQKNKSQKEFFIGIYTKSISVVLEQKYITSDQPDKVDIIKRVLIPS